MIWEVAQIFLVGSVFPPLFASVSSTMTAEFTLIAEGVRKTDMTKL